MMYLAMRNISESKQDGTVLVHPKGTFIKGFEAWSYVTRKALLDHGRVHQVADVDAGSAVHDDGAVSPVVVVPAGPDLVCELCPDKSFASVQGLKLHKARKHP